MRAAQDANSNRTVIVAGLCFGAFGSLFLFFFFPWRALDELFLAMSARSATGIVRQESETNMSVEETKVREYAFEFTTGKGERISADCYVTGAPWQRGDKVNVRYVSWRPEIACIEGGRLNKAGLSAAFVALFPFLGFGLAAWGISGRRQAARLLREGRAVEVDVLAVDATKAQMNYQTVYKITISAPVPAAGSSLTLRRWGKVEVSLLTARALNKEPIYVLCDPDKPKRLIFPEALIEPPSS